MLLMFRCEAATSNMVNIKLAVYAEGNFKYYLDPIFSDNNMFFPVGIGFITQQITCMNGKA